MILFLYISNIDRHITRLWRFPFNWIRNADPFVLSLSLSGRLYSHGCALQLLTVFVLSTIQRAPTHTIDFWRKNYGALAKNWNPPADLARLLRDGVCCVCVFMLLLYNCCWPLGIVPPYPALDSRPLYQSKPVPPITFIDARVFSLWYSWDAPNFPTCVSELLSWDNIGEGNALIVMNDTNIRARPKTFI